MSGASEAPSSESALLKLLGGASFEGESKIPRLERKTAGLVAYLALEGPTGRSRVAGLLWPSSKEATARNNLAQTIRRLRAASGMALIEGDAALGLAGVAVDVRSLLERAEAGDDAAAVSFTGDLLAGYDFDDEPDFDLWLRAKRATVSATWSRAALARIEGLRDAGELDAAVEVAQRLVERDPLAEAGTMALMTTWLERGDVPLALRAFERYRATLDRELAMKPSAAMMELFRAARESKPKPKKGAAAPATVARSKWVGREREMEAVARAFGRAQWVLLRGEPGVGKSRLAREIADGRGPAFLVEGRPGDLAVPFSALARAVRASTGGRRIDLAPWVRAELARIAPELAGDMDVSPPSVRSKLRFFEAVFELLRARVERDGTTHVVLDDLQWFDSASAEVSLWLADRAAGLDPPVRTIGLCRTGELAGEVETAIERARVAGAAALVDLGPLSASETRSLVASFGVPAVERRVEEVLAVSKGNPLFAVEIVRALLEAEDPSSAKVELPERVRSLLERRLARLGTLASRVAGVLALAGPDIDLELAAHVLDARPLELADALRELEDAQIVVDRRFVHDLMAETARDGLASAVRAHVHAKTAEHLERRGADPARIGFHFERAGEPRRAAPHLLAAGHAARGMSRIADAGALYERASVAFEAGGDRRAASEALYMRCRSHMGARAGELVSRLERLAESDFDRARALCTKANVALELGELEEARVAATEAIPLARRARDKLVEVESIQAQLDADLRRGRMTEAADAFHAFRESSRALSDDPEAGIAVTFYEAAIHALEDRHREAVAAFDAALDELDRWGQLRHGKSGILAHAARSLIALGDLEEAGARLDEAERYLAETTGAMQAWGQVHLSRAILALARGDLEAASLRAREITLDRFELRVVLWARQVAGEARARATAFSSEPVEELQAIADDPRADGASRAAAALVLLSAPDDAVTVDARAALAALVQAMGTPAQRARAGTAGGRTIARKRR